MATTETKYYKLRRVHDDGEYPAGSGVAASVADIRIGQQPGCDVSMSNTTQWADELFAVIRPCRSTQGWLLVPASQHVRTWVNGTEVDLMHYLADGDRISFDGHDQELVFEIGSDPLPDGHTGTMALSAPPASLPMRWIIAGSALVVALIAGLAAMVHTNAQRENRRAQVLAEAQQAVMQISVDSVYLIRRTASGDSIIDSYSFEAERGVSISGTAFLTADSMLLTARHCIEPWLNDDEALQAESINSIHSLPTRWAMMAETWNQTHSGDTLLRVVSVCSLFRGEQGMQRVPIRLTSDDFEIDTSRDDIIEMGDYNRECYWRSVRARHARRDMMLGDLACLSAFTLPGDSLQSTIFRPTGAQLAALVHPGTRLGLMGYPEYEVAGFEVSEGLVKRAYADGEMIAHNGRLVHGYSGGPAIVVLDGKAVAVGVISVIDTRGGDRTYSVPLTALHKKGVDL